MSNIHDIIVEDVDNDINEEWVSEITLENLNNSNKLLYNRLFPCCETNIKHFKFDNPIKFVQNSLDNFEIGKHIGVGSNANVYLARLKDFKEFIVSIKVLYKYKLKNIGAKKQVENEVKSLSKLEHKHIVKLYDIFQDDSKIYMVQEYCSNGDLKEYMERKNNKRLNEKNTINVIYSISSALLHCHKNGVIHRDIKPENILINHKHHVKLGDFGWAYISNDIKKEEINQTCGTFDYMSPEILSMKSYNYKIDNWCLGVLFYELLVGNPPFEHPNISKTKFLIKNVSYEFPQTLNINVNIKLIIHKLLNKNCKQRLSIYKILSDDYIKSVLKIS